MKIPRREFLSLLGVSAGAAGLGACGTTWEVPDRLVELARRGPGLERQVQSLCGLCRSGCGSTVRLVDGLPVGLKGNPNHPVNRGGLCPVGQAALDVLYSPRRLRTPLRRTPAGDFAPIGWEEALGHIAGVLSGLRERGEGGRIALLTGDSNRLLDDLAGQFLGVLGSSSLASWNGAAVLPFTLSQGVSELPAFDLAEADLVLSFGLDLFEDGPAPLHALSALIGERASTGRASLLHVGSRPSPSASKAQLYVAVRPGTHGAFALGVAHVLVREGRYDQEFVQQRTFGFEDWTEDGRREPGFRRLLLERWYPDLVADICGCTAANVVSVARRFADSPTPLAVSGGEAEAGSNATWNALAVHALNALMGVFNRPGGVLAPPLLPWSPLPPLPTVAAPSVFDTLRLGVAETLARSPDSTAPLQALLVVEANPVYWTPPALGLADALRRIPLVVAVGPFLDETAQQADIVLPSHHPLEAWQAVPAPAASAFSAAGISPPLVEPFYETRHPADMLLELGRRSAPGSSASLPWPDYGEYLRDRFRGVSASGKGSPLTGTFEEDWKHFLEQRGWRFVRRRAEEDFWNELTAQAGWWSPPARTDSWERIFPHESHRYEFFSRRLRRLLVQSAEGESKGRALEQAIDRLGLAARPDEACLPHYEPSREYGEGDLTLVPFRPLTARGELGSASSMVLEMFGCPVLSGWETWAELDPGTASELGLEDGDWVAIESEQGRIEVRLRVQPGTAPGGVYVALGLGRSLEPAAEVSGANPVEILSLQRDSLSGRPTLASTRVRLRRLQQASGASRRWMEGAHG